MDIALYLDTKDVFVEYINQNIVHKKDEREP